MRNSIVMLACAGVVLLASGFNQVHAESPTTAAQKACTATAPAALRALGTSSAQILDCREAHQVRGQWWIFLPLQSGTMYDSQGNPTQFNGAIYFRGVGQPFNLDVLTYSNTYARPVSIRVTIGR